MILSILIAAIAHRHEKLCALLECLDAQMQPGVEAIVYQDNLETPWTAKCRALDEAATGAYTVHIDDDDMVAENYIAKILDALETEPDYVGFQVRWTIDGVKQLPVYHSLIYSNWYDTPNALFRDLTDKNPIKRSLSRLATWRGGNGADRDWAAQLRGFVKSEVYIPEELYLYQMETQDTYLTKREPLTGPLPELPSYPWLRTLSAVSA